MNIETPPADFTDEQKRYLEGFATGLQISKAGRGFGGTTAGKPNHELSGPDAAHIKAQDSVIASGKKLTDQEKFKRDNTRSTLIRGSSNRRWIIRRLHRRIISDGAITACSMSRRHRIPTCAA